MAFTDDERRLRGLRKATFEVEERTFPGAREHYLRQLIDFRAEVRMALAAVSVLPYRAAELRPNSELAAQLRRLASTMEAEIGPIADDSLWHQEIGALLAAPVLERGLWRLARPEPKA